MSRRPFPWILQMEPGRISPTGWSRHGPTQSHGRCGAWAFLSRTPSSSGRPPLHRSMDRSGDRGRRADRGASGLSPDRALGFYLLLAPLVPMAGVAAACGPGWTRSYELAVTTPYSQLRVLLLRTAAVLVCAVPLAAPRRSGSRSVGEAVRMAAARLAFGPPGPGRDDVVPPDLGGQGVAGGWTALCVLSTLQQHQLLLVSRPAVAACTLVAVGAALLLLSRRHALSTVPRMGVLGDHDRPGLGDPAIRLDVSA